MRARANESQGCGEVESKGNHPLYLSAVCLWCLSGHNKVTCCYCSAEWQGSIHQIGTMYSYDLFAATPCCMWHVTCTQYNQPVVDLQKHSLRFWQLSQQVGCSHCSSSGFDLVKPPSTFHVSLGSVTKILVRVQKWSGGTTFVRLNLVCPDQIWQLKMVRPDQKWSGSRISIELLQAV